MSLAQTFAHIINIMMFAYAAFLYLKLTRMVWRSQLSAIYKEIAIKEALAAIFVSGVFVIMQLDWILAEVNTKVGDWRSWGWLVFDYCLAIFMCYHADKERLRVHNDIVMRCPYVSPNLG